MRDTREAEYFCCQTIFFRNVCWRLSFFVRFFFALIYGGEGTRVIFVGKLHKIVLLSRSVIKETIFFVVVFVFNFSVYFKIEKKGLEEHLI